PRAYGDLGALLAETIRSGLAELAASARSRQGPLPLPEQPSVAMHEVGPTMSSHSARTMAGWPPVREPAEGIRATVIGAGEYTVQVSGNTSFISCADVLPVHG